MRVIFLGTPDFALPPLRALCAAHEVVAVVTQPDKAGNRGSLAVPPVKEFARERGLPVYQFAKIRTDGAEVLRSLMPDVMVTAAYGQILSREIIDIPKHGILNIHASLLPKYRGSSPIQWAIINGETETGVTIMRTEEGLDCGDILLQKKIDIAGGETAESVFDRLSQLGAQAIVEALSLIESGNAEYRKQDATAATYFPMLKKADGKIDWSDSAKNIRNKVRGMSSWPVAFAVFGGKTVKIHSAEISDTGAGGNVGEVVGSNKEILVKCGAGALSLCVLQAEGKRKMSAADFLNGTRIKLGDRFE